MSAWEQFKKGFDSWEDSTAKVLERVLKSPSFVGPSGGLLSAYMRARAKNDARKEKLWSEVGVATRLDQERTLFLLNRLESKLFDLEERMDVLVQKLEASEAKLAKAPKSGARDKSA